MTYADDLIEQHNNEVDKMGRLREQLAQLHEQHVQTYIAVGDALRAEGSSIASAGNGKIERGADQR